MTAVRLQGVDARAVAARTALHRLRWEAGIALAQGHAAEVASLDLAEAVGILTNILEQLAAALPAEHGNDPDVLATARDRFAEQVQYFTGYHQVPR